MKRGLSQVITVLIVTLLVLVAIALIWLVIAPLLREQAEISEAQSKLLVERVDIKRVQFDPIDNSKLNLSLKKLTGRLELESIEMVEAPPTNLDVVSAADISGSMRECRNIPGAPEWVTDCCVNYTGGYYYGGSCFGVDFVGLNNCTNVCSGTLIDGLSPTQNANKDLVDALFERPQDNNHMGLIAYRDYVKNTSEGSTLGLSNDTVYLKTTIDLWESHGGTCICCGINNATSKLSSSSADVLKTIIVMSDGIPTSGVLCDEQGTGNASLDAIQAACDAYATLENLTIYTVGLGGDVNDQLMQDIATQCGPGDYFPAYDIGQLIQIYEAIANQIIKTYRSLNRFNYLKVVFYTDSESTFRNIDIPNLYETRTYNFDLSGDITPPLTKIEVYPVIVSSTGKEILGAALDIWNG